MKIIAITGASDGIGAEMARQLASAHGNGLKEEGAMSVEACARLILRGMNRRDREVVMTFRGRLGHWLKLMAPGKVEAMALTALKDSVKPP